MTLEILFQDEYLVAINKPTGLLVHRSSIARDATEFALQLLRDQIGQPVFPAHRLDRKTSGVLLYSLNKEVDKLMKKQFSERETKKVYHAIVRGFSPKELEIDYVLKNEKGKEQNAVTHWKTLEYFELNVPLGKHPTSRYSYVEMRPETGRFHQLRKHAAHIRHPIIGDRPHGCNKQNRMWKEKWGMTRMLLHASELSFLHPVNKVENKVVAGIDGVFENVLARLRKGRPRKSGIYSADMFSAE